MSSGSGSLDGGVVKQEKRLQSEALPMTFELREGTVWRLRKFHHRFSQQTFPNPNKLERRKGGGRGSPHPPLTKRDEREKEREREG